LIAGPVPEEVGDLGQLKTLELDNNKLTGNGIKWLKMLCGSAPRFKKHSASSMCIFYGSFVISWVSVSFSHHAMSRTRVLKADLVLIRRSFSSRALEGTPNILQFLRDKLG